MEFFWMMLGIGAALFLMLAGFALMIWADSQN